MSNRRLRACEICGTDYRPTYSAQRTCGRTCGWALRVREGNIRRREPNAPKPPKVCSECGESYGQGGYRYCSHACRDAARRRIDLLRYGKTPDEVDRCDQCQSPVPIKRKRCDDCRDATTRAARRRKRRAERARRRGVLHEPYTLADIAARDRHRCGLCRKRVAMTKAVPHPKAPTIDHVVPIAAGGDDTRANVQLAHFQCNWMKRDGGTQQLALVG